MKKQESIYQLLGKQEANTEKSMILYQEPLGCDCNLVVYPDQAYIEYDFSKYGKARTHVYHVPIEEIGQHLEALKANLNIYQNTKSTTGKFPISYKGLRDMFICINTKNPGVCIHKYYFPVATEEDYKKYETAFQNIQEKVKKIRKKIQA